MIKFKSKFNLCDFIVAIELNKKIDNILNKIDNKTQYYKQIKLNINMSF